MRLIREQLQSFVKDSASLLIVNARVILRTVVDVLEPKKDQEEDTRLVDKVSAALRDMGYSAWAQDLPPILASSRDGV